MKISRESVGLAVRAARQAARLSLLDLSGATQISASALSRIENGIRSLDFVEASTLAEALKVDLEHFKNLASTYEENGLAEAVSKNKEILSDIRRLQRSAILTAIEAAA